jgi:hypothetical protein
VLIYLYTSRYQEDTKDARSSCIQRNVRVIPDLISLSPATHDIGTANDNRRHDLKVLFNGAWRRVSAYLFFINQSCLLFTCTFIVPFCYSSVSCCFHSFHCSSLNCLTVVMYRDVRTAAVDSKLPMDPSLTILGMCVRSPGHSNNAPLALWPSLVEKAVCPFTSCICWMSL